MTKLPVYFNTPCLLTDRFCLLRETRMDRRLSNLMSKAHRIIVPVLSGIVLSMIASYWPSQLDPSFIAYGRTVNPPQAVVLKRLIPGAAKPGSTFIARLIQYIGPGTVQIKTLSFEDAGIT